MRPIITLGFAILHTLSVSLLVLGLGLVVTDYSPRAGVLAVLVGGFALVVAGAAARVALDTSDPYHDWPQ